MSNFLPSLVIDDRRELGWARVEIYGDKEQGKRLLNAAQHLLGAVKVENGVNQRIVDGEPGGYYHRWTTLSDGSRIHAVTNDGHDMVRIYVAADEPNPQVKKPRKDDVNPNDYMWIGVRVKDGCTRPYYALDVHLVEPDGTVRRGYIGAAFSGLSWGVDINAVYTEADGFKLDTGSDGANADALHAEMYRVWHSGAFPFSSTMREGDHQFRANAYGWHDPDFSIIGFSSNGVIFQYWIADSAQSFGPHDPRMNADDNAGAGRSFAGMNTSGISIERTQRFGWDGVFTLDPFDDVAARAGVKDVDKRVEMLAFTKFLRDNDFIAKPQKQVQDGEYKLFARAYGVPTELQSSRQGDTIPDFPSFGRSTYCDYRDYLQPTGSFANLEVEVEVRLGRLVLTQREGLPNPAEQDVSLSPAVFHFDLTCAQYDDRNAVAWPHGATSVYDSCLRDNGPNMDGPSYSEVIDINVKARTAKLGGGLPSPGFGDAGYVESQPTVRRSAMFFVYGGVFPQPADADWETYAARALFTAVESVTSGVYGCSEISEMSEGGLKGLFSGTNKDNVYAYDGNGGLTNLGHPSTLPADWASNDPPDDSTNFYWYYEKAVPYKNNCFNTYGVLVSSVGGFYEMDQNFVGTPGYGSPSCC